MNSTLNMLALQHCHVHRNVKNDTRVRHFYSARRDGTLLGEPREGGAGEGSAEQGEPGGALHLDHHVLSEHGYEEHDAKHECINDTLHIVDILHGGN